MSTFSHRFFSTTLHRGPLIPPIYPPRLYRMAPLSMTVTFLGTSSGGGPSESRNCSSLVADVHGDNSLWSVCFHLIFSMVCDHNWSLVVDCAEGTLRQFAWQPYGAHRLKVSRLTKIFITHMHGKISNVYVETWHNIHTADHTMGLATILRSALGMPQPDAGASHKMVRIILTYYSPLNLSSSPKLRSTARRASALSYAQFSK